MHKVYSLIKNNWQKMLTKSILLSFISRISAVKCICGGNQSAENGFGKKRVK